VPVTCAGLATALHFSPSDHLAAGASADGRACAPETWPSPR
jgi:hypothetical protein